MSEFNQNIAVVIGVDHYGRGINSLSTAVNDAKSLTEILRLEHGYKVHSLLDKLATLKNINQILSETLPQEVTSDDRLLFYFAGHGIALNGDEGPEGHLIPQDAKLGDTSTYLSMLKLQAALSELPCRHFLGILDCCFAGAFRWSSTRDLLSVPEVIHKERYDRFIQDPAWQVITSAAYDQKALDSLDLKGDRGIAKNNTQHSPFAVALMEALSGKADVYPPSTNGYSPGDGVITATELYLYLRDAVEPATEEHRQRQTPGIWPLKKHDKGEYIFLSPGHILNLPPAPPLNETKNPYRGLESFDEEHSKQFFGRTELVEKLRNFVKTHPLTVVLGASGSGKSSLVKAGLIPELRQDNTEQWCILPPIRPGETPLQALNSALRSAQLTEVEPQNLQHNLAQSLDVWAKNNPDSKLLLFIDQSEEIITLCQNEDERKEFFQEILKAINTHRHRLRVVLSLRSDFEPQVRAAGLKFVPTVLTFGNTELKNDWQDGRFLLPAMTRGELREAIEKPAETRVMYFQPHELVEQLIDEVVDMPGALPLLPFALSELYLKYLKRQRDAQNRGITIDRALRQEDYQDLRGVIQSLTQRADEEYEALVNENPAYAQVIRHVMLRMIALGGDELARRRVPLSELEYPPEKNGLVKEVMEGFTKARLLVKGEDAQGNPYVEPAHDALVRGWKRLLAWKQEDEESLLLQRRLTPAAEEWKSQEMVKFLWNANPRLDLLKKVLNSDDNWLNKVEAEFVQHSIGRKSFNTRRNWSIATVVILGLSVLTIVALIFRGLSKINEAKTLRESAEINLQKNQSLDGMVDSLEAGKILNDLDVQLLLLVERLRYGTDLRKQVSGTLLSAYYTVRELNRQEKDRGTVRTSFSPDGKLLTSAAENGTVRVWDVPGQSLSERTPIQCEPGKCEPVKIARFSPNGQKLATAGANGTVRVWNLKGKKLTELKKWDTKQGEVKSISFNPAGKLLATAGANGTVNIWNLKNLSEKPEILCVFHSCDKHGVVWSVAFSRDGKRLASTGDNGTIRLWDRKGIEWKENIKFLPKQNDKDVTSVTSVNFSPNGQKLATAGTDGNVHVWDLQDKESARALIEIPTNQNKIWEVSFSSDGQELASAGEDGSVRLWDYSQKLELEKLEGHHGPVRSVSFRRNDQELASAGDDGSARLWKLQGNASEKFAVPIKKASTGQQKVEIQNGNQRAFGNKDGTVTWKGKMKSSHVGAVKSLAFNPDGTQLASGGKDRTIRLWNVNGEQQQILQTYAPVNSLAYSSDKHWLASAGEDSSVQLWNLKDLQEGKPYAAWKAYQGAVKNISFSQDGKVLITSGKDRTAKLRKIEWQIESFDELMTRGCNRVRDYLKNNPNVSDRDLCDTFQSLEAAKQVPPVEQLLTEPFVNPSPQITQTQTEEVPVKERPEKTQPSVGTKAPKVNKKSGAPSQKETPPLSSPAKAPLKDKSKLKSTKLRANRLPSQRMGAKPTSGTPSNVMIDSSQEVPLKRKEPAAAPAVTSSVDCYSAQAKQTYQCRNRKN